MFEKIKRRGFQVLPLHHAEAILKYDMGTAVKELQAVLADIAIPVEELIRGGGGEGALTQRLRKALADVHGWKKHSFQIQRIVDGEPKESISHEIDHVKVFSGGTFALEIEWNNKHPFFDRDLENFKRLHADGAISVGGIITRGKTLQSGLRQLILDFARREGITSIAKVAQFYRPTSRVIV
jgi:hypothetical protein